MAGRRMRYVCLFPGVHGYLIPALFIHPNQFPVFASELISEALRVQLISSGILDNSAYVVIAGPANTYGHYVATREEYSIQRYEGASMIFGPG